MTIDEVRAWAANHIMLGKEPVAFYFGVLDATRGEFDESQCEPAGFAGKTEYCAGGREALLRLEQPEPVGRVAHGTTVGG